MWLSKALTHTVTNCKQLQVCTVDPMLMWQPCSHIEYQDKQSEVGKRGSMLASMLSTQTGSSCRRRVACIVDQLSKWQPCSHTEVMDSCKQSIMCIADQMLRSVQLIHIAALCKRSRSNRYDRMSLLVTCFHIEVSYIWLYSGTLGSMWTSLVSSQTESLCSLLEDYKHGSM